MFLAFSSASKADAGLCHLKKRRRKQCANVSGASEKIAMAAKHLSVVIIGAPPDLVAVP